ncbi:MAG: hypothetical protein D6814_10935 [Calditrichaeota bacterium]|nr:MAG: hypothetical protein D6814_10935 [Calditrichota bacterium]
MPYSIRGAASALGQEQAAKGVGFQYATNWSFSPLEMMTFLLPSFFGFGGQTYWGTMPFTDYPNYMGILILLLAVFALVSYKKPPVRLFGGIILLALLISFGKHFAIFYKLLYNYLPFFNKFRVPVMILIVVQMGVAILAGFGLQRVLELLQTPGNPYVHALWARRLFITAGAILLIALVLTVARQGFFNVMQGLYPDRYAPSMQLQLDRQRFDMLLTDWWLVSLWLAGGFVLWGLALQKRIKAPSLALGILIISLADLWAVDFKLNHPSSKSQIDQYLAPDEITRFLQADTTLYRIFPVGGLFNENRWAAQSIQSIGGYHAAKPRVFQDFMDATSLPQNYVMKYYKMINRGGQRALQPLDPGQIDPAVRANHQNLIDFLNLKYIISPYPIPESSLRFRAQVQYFMGNRPVKLSIYENTRVLPRAYLVGSYQLKPTPREALGYLASEKFDPRTQVVLYQTPAPEPVPDSTAVAKVVSYQLQHVVVETQSKQPQLLVLSDTYYPPGWRVTIDGQPEQILQANHAFRAVAVPAGTHQVVFFYHSRLFTAGLWCSLISLLAIAGCFFLGWRKKESS